MRERNNLANQFKSSSDDSERWGRCKVAARLDKTCDGYLISLLQSDYVSRLLPFLIKHTSPFSSQSPSTHMPRESLDTWQHNYREINCSNGFPGCQNSDSAFISADSWEADPRAALEGERSAVRFALIRLVPGGGVLSEEAIHICFVWLHTAACWLRMMRVGWGLVFRSDLGC